MAPRDRPGRPGSAPLTADELVAAVRVHFDRVHDAVRRTSGLDGPAAVEVVRASALATVDEVATRPLGAAQAVGTWFRRALDLAAGAPDAPVDGGPLAALPDDARTVVLLRDAYDLPLTAVAVALGTDEDDVLRRVAQARSQVPAAGAPSDVRERAHGSDPGGTPVRPSPAGSGAHPDLTALARLADDHLVAGADEAARRHVPACGACRAVVQGQSRAARAVAALVVVGPDDAARESVVADVERAARQRLPGGATSSGGVVAVEEPTGPFALPAPDPAGVPPRATEDTHEEQHRRLLSPLLVVLSVVLAALAGVGAGLLLSQRDQPSRLTASDGRLPAGVRLVSPQATPPATLPSPPTVAEQRPRTTVVVVPPSPLPSPSPTPTPTPSPTPSPAAATLGVQPASGPAGTELAVTGTGFPPGAQVRVDYLDADGEPTGPGADVVAGADGTLAATVVAGEPDDEPGPHDVVATAGEVTARATFTVEEP